MPKDPETWTLEGFLNYFLTIHHDMQDRAFAFVLGAGASKSSGIPTGAELVDRWLQELHTRLVLDGKKDPLANWATAENLAIEGFELSRAATFYPQVYSRRFGDDPEEGFAELERIMEAKEPSFGYSVLARILAETRHQVVITTNFDDLVTDALFIYTNRRPLVCGHESLAEFIRPRMRRPVIAKIHRDLLLAPKSSPADTSELDQRWTNPLKILFRYCSPIFIGYGGNDGTLMGLLEQLDPKEAVGRAAWCYYEKDGLPDERIRKIVARLHGFLVPIPGFDELMLLLGNHLSFPLLTESIKKRAEQRVEGYQKSVESIQSHLSMRDLSTSTLRATSVDLNQALEATIDRVDDSSSLRLKARAAADHQQREKLYREALERYPNDPFLMMDLADFLMEKDRRDEAESLYRKALEIEPELNTARWKLADFLGTTGQHDEAERFYRQAMEAEPQDAFIPARFADFLWKYKKDHRSAEEWFKLALSLNSNDHYVLWRFSAFLEDSLKEYDQAERLLRQAVETSGKAFDYWNLGRFLASVRNDLDEAERLYRTAVKSAPRNPSYIRDLVALLKKRGRDEEAFALQKKTADVSKQQPPD